MGLREPRLLVGGHGLTDPKLRATATTLLVVAVAFGAAIGSSFPSYASTSEFHFAMELVGSLLGLLAGYALLARFLANGQRVDLFVGVGFALNGATDVAHGFLPLAVARGWIQITATDVQRFIPATYATGRFLMALSLFLGVAFASRLGHTDTPARETRLAVSCGSALALGLTALAFFWEAPRAVIDGPISRPGDLVSATLFLATAWLVLSRPREVDGERWLAASAFLGAVGQFVVALSGALFDARFDLGHLAKVLSYAVVTFGFVRGQVQLIARERETVEELREADAAKTGFLGSVSHELRTPLSAIHGLTMLLDGDPEPDADLRHDIVKRLRRNSVTLTTLVEDILLYSRLEADHLAFVPVQLDLTDAARQVVRTLKPLLNGHSVEVSGSATHVVADRQAIERIITNLVTNAAHYAPVPSQIRLTAGSVGTVTWLTCEDAGPGIDADEQVAIFERFHRGRAGVASSQPGTGIGLNVVRDLAAAMEGEVILDRSPDLGGARFTLRLPSPGAPRPTKRAGSMPHSSHD